MNSNVFARTNKRIQRKKDVMLLAVSTDDLARILATKCIFQNGFVFHKIFGCSPLKYGLR
jgi:hypothetical protein